MKTSRHFAPWEVLPGIAQDITWDTLPDSEAEKIDQRILGVADDIRDLVGPCTVNDYHLGGSRHFCGVRTPECPEYSLDSMHSVTESRPCGAVDLHPRDMDAEAARTLIRKAVGAGGLADLGGLETDVSWVHVDVRPRHADGSLVEFSA